MPENQTDFVTIALMPSGRRGTVPKGTNLLEAARRLGVELESICAGRQTCGKCQVIVEEGHFPKHGLTSAASHLTPVDGREAKYLAEHALPPGRRLACACEVIGDLLLVVPEESQARKQIIAKAATDRVIDVQPAVRQVYVEVEAATLESHGSDWGRLQRALAEQWQIKDASIDLPALLDLQPALAKGKHALTVTLWHDREVLRVQPGYSEGAFGL
ncbi:MAG: 2Fe-2S iron-sulfur cluster-binding protein, partial [Anaerolineales bacterium]|nr:2Fe-2S iron-sulfur cluster-binding protein [Anaerolineales bacterium]